jgi:hypothetical protein
MQETEREKTTRFAVNRISKEIDESYDWISALLLSAIYVDIRLRSLLTDRLSPREARWKEVHTQLGELWGVNRRITLCKNLELISGDMARNLKELREVRSQVAHESRIWVELTKEDMERMVHLCGKAMRLLKETNNKPKVAKSRDGCSTGEPTVLT